MIELLNLGIESIFINNILLSLFLGMCSFLGCAKNIKTAHGLGLAVIFVLTITAPVNWLLNHFFLRSGAFTWMGFAESDLSFLVFVTFIATIAGMVQLVEMIMEKFKSSIMFLSSFYPNILAPNQ